MRPHDSRRLVTAFAFLLASGLLVACNGGKDDQPSVNSPGAVQDSTTPSSKEMSEQVIGGFYEGLKKYTSFEEAEAVAGYHILRPSSDYPVGFGLTYLLWNPGLQRPESETNYTYLPISPGGFRVLVTPSYYYSKGDDTVTSSEPVAVGGKAGWMLEESDITRIFVFECGSVDDVKVWCQVESGKNIGLEAFDHFVSTLQ